MSTNDIEHRYHSLIMMPTVQDTRDKVRLAIYKRIWDYLSSGYAVVYAAESDPSKIIRQVSKLAKDSAPADKTEIENYITSGALTILSMDEFYSPSKTQPPDINKMLGLWHSHILKAQKRSKHRGVIAIGNPSTLLELDNKHWIKLAEYERAIGKELARPVEAICWYSNAKVVAKLSFSNLVTIINYHHSTIHDGWSYREWHPYDIVAQVEDGMDRMLGEGTTRLIFKTLKLVYKIDPERTIIFQPEAFEEKLTKIMGSSVSQLLFEVLADALRKEMSFTRISQTH